MRSLHSRPWMTSYFFHMHVAEKRMSFTPVRYSVHDVSFRWTEGAHAAMDKAARRLKVLSAAYLTLPDGLHGLRSMHVR